MAVAAVFLSGVTAGFALASAATYGTSAGSALGRIRKIIVTSTLDHHVAINFSAAGTDDHLIIRNGTQLYLDLSDLQASLPAIRLRHLGAAPTAGSLFISVIGQN